MSGLLLMGVSGSDASAALDEDAELIRPVLDFTGLDEDAWMAEINTAVTGLKTDGLWDKLECWLPGIGNTIGNALVDFRNPTRTVTPVDTPTLNAWASVEFNGTSQYVNTGCNPGDGGSHVYTQNDASLGLEFLTENNTLTFACGTAGSPQSVQNTLIIPRSSGEAWARVSNATNTAQARAAVASSIGFFLAQRTASDAYALYRNNTLVDADTAVSDTIVNLPIFWGCWNANGTAGVFRAGAQRHFFVGSSFDATQRGNLETRLDTYTTATAGGF